MPSSLRKYGLLEGIEQLVNKMRLQEKIKFRFITPTKLNAIDDALQVAIYRIVQEFANNSIKHSSCKNIKITLLQKESQVLLNVKDDGCGFDASAVTLSNGIGNMESRAKAYNGSLKLTSKIGVGTELQLVFPI